MTIKTLHKLTAGLAIAMVFSSCVKDENSYGYEYMPDMYRSPAPEAYVDYGEVRTWKTDTSLTNKQSAKLPPLGTIPFSGNNVDANYSLPYKRLPSKAMIGTHGLTSLEYNDGDYEASVADANPMPLYESNVAKGKVLYDRFCDHCHGEKGAGDGKVANHDAINPPADAFTKPDGQMFYSITYGKGVMGAHKSQLNQKERWQVINYIKSMNGATVMPDPINKTSGGAGNGKKSSIEDDFSADALVSSLTALAQETAEDANHTSEHSLNLDHLVFATGSANLDMAMSQSTLDGLVSFMKATDKNIEFDGYTDNTGDADANLTLSQLRADAVKAYLVGNGIDASRIEAKGYGSANPKADNATEEGRAQNRRTEVKIK